MTIYHVEYLQLLNGKVICSVIVKSFIFEDNANKFADELIKSIDSNHCVKVTQSYLD